LTADCVRKEATIRTLTIKVIRFQNRPWHASLWTANPIRSPENALLARLSTDAQYNLVSWALNSFGVPLDDFLPGAGP
jgi:hypothetical protein